LMTVETAARHMQILFKILGAWSSCVSYRTVGRSWHGHLQGDVEDEKIGCGHFRDPGWRHAGPRRPQRGPRRWLPTRRVASPLSRREVRRDHDRVDEARRRLSSRP
jgi:hypothetical protein